MSLRTSCAAAGRDLQIRFFHYHHLQPRSGSQVLGGKIIYQAQRGEAWLGSSRLGMTRPDLDQAPASR